MSDPIEPAAILDATEENNNRNHNQRPATSPTPVTNSTRQTEESRGDIVPFGESNACSDNCEGICQQFQLSHSLGRFYRKLYECYRNEEFCDGILRTEDSGTFYVHRIVLCSESEYFRALFTSTVNTGPTHDILIRGVTSDNLDACIQFIYTRKVCLNKEIVTQILATADYLGLVLLKDICCEYIEKQLDIKNCFGILEYSRSLFCQELEKSSKAFILKNFTELSQENEEILDLSLTEAVELFGHEELNVKMEETVWHAVIRWILHNSEERQKHILDLMSVVRTGLMDTSFFMEHVKDHPFVRGNDAVRPLVISTLRFLYDLDTGESTLTPSLVTPSLAMPRIPYEVMFAIGGWCGGSPTNAVEAYDTRADRWRTIAEADPLGPRAYHGTLTYQNEIFMIGGFNGQEYFNSTRAFNIVTKTWRARAPMLNKRCYVSVAMLEGRYIYALGGYDGIVRQNTAERYDPEVNQWTQIASMNAQRSDASATELNGKIYICGGFNGTECLPCAEVYDPVTNQWSSITSMRTRRSGVSCIAYHGFVYVVGGFNGLSRLCSGERYDPETETWTNIPDMYNPRSNFAIEVIDDMIFAVGGFNGVSTIPHVECFDDRQNEWYEATDMGLFRSALSCCVVSDIPNIRDYIYEDRGNLVEERRQRITTIQNQQQIIQIDLQE